MFCLQYEYTSIQAKTTQKRYILIVKKSSELLVYKSYTQYCNHTVVLVLL